MSKAAKYLSATFTFKFLRSTLRASIYDVHAGGGEGGLRKGGECRQGQSSQFQSLHLFSEPISGGVRPKADRSDLPSNQGKIARLAYIQTTYVVSSMEEVLFLF